jgi:hypothetical protein
MEFICGMIGGIVGTLFSHPVDTVKTRIQSQKAISIIQGFKMGKLYSGVQAPLAGIGLEKIIVFGSYSLLLYCIILYTFV